MQTLIEQIPTTTKQQVKQVVARIPVDLLEKVNVARERNNHTLTDIIRAGFQTYVKESETTSETADQATN